MTAFLVEARNNPAKALCDGTQSLDIDQFQSLMDELKKCAVVVGKVF